MRHLSGVFSNNEYKILPYCIYNDLSINAVIGLDGNLQICDKDKSVTSRTVMESVFEKRINQMIYEN